MVPLLEVRQEVLTRGHIICLTNAQGMYFTYNEAVGIRVNRYARLGKRTDRSKENGTESVLGNKANMSFRINKKEHSFPNKPNYVL